MNVSTRFASLYPAERERGRPSLRTAAPESRSALADELVRAVRLDLEDVELRVQRVVRLRREAEVTTEDRVLDHDLLDVADDVAAILDLTLAGVARLLDRVERDLGRE